MLTKLNYFNNKAQKSESNYKKDKKKNRKLN